MVPAFTLKAVPPWEFTQEGTEKYPDFPPGDAAQGCVRLFLGRM